MIDLKFDTHELPGCVVDYISLVLNKMRYGRKVRGEVGSELAGHFSDALADCGSEGEREERALELIEGFGDARVLARLIRRGKKRCRPVWKKGIVRGFQAMGVFILLFCFYTGWFISGRPRISIDYLEKINELVRPAAVESENAWHYYERAIELYVEPEEEINELAYKIGRRYLPRKSFTDLEAEERIAIEKWIKQNEVTWGEIMEGGRRTYSYKEYQMEDSKQLLLSLLLPHLGELRSLARMGIWRARWELNSGRIKVAMQDCVDVARMGRRLQGRGFLVEQLIGIDICALANEELLQLSESEGLSVEILQETQGRLEMVYPKGYPLMSVEGERLWFLDSIQHVFTEGGIGGGHIIPGKTTDVYNYTTIEQFVGVEGFFARSAIYLGYTMMHAGRDKTIAKGNDVYDQLGRIMRMSPYKRKVNCFNDDVIFSDIPLFRYFHIRAFMPAASRASDVGFQNMVLYESVVTVLALRRWQLEKGEYPEQLGELLEGGYLEQLPGDPYSDGVLRYERRGDDFVLYSLGGDFDDDGGVVNPDDPWGASEEGGDRVFWPVDKN